MHCLSIVYPNPNLAIVYSYTKKEPSYLSLTLPLTLPLPVPRSSPPFPIPLSFPPSPSPHSPPLDHPFCFFLYPCTPSCRLMEVSRFVWGICVMVWWLGEITANRKWGWEEGGGWLRRQVEVEHAKHCVIIWQDMYVKWLRDLTLPEWHRAQHLNQHTVLLHALFVQVRSRTKILWLHPSAVCMGHGAYQEVCPQCLIREPYLESDVGMSW